MKTTKFLALAALGAALGFLGTLQVAKWMDYWERKNRVTDPYLVPVRSIP